MLLKLYLDFELPNENVGITNCLRQFIIVDAEGSNFKFSRIRIT